MKRVFLIVSFLIFANLLHSQVLKGVVTDTLGNPLAGVNVLVLNNNQGVFTDGNGKYSIELKPLVYNVQFSMLGFKTKGKTVTVIGKETVLNVQLISEVYLTDEVIVAATRAGDNVPATYTDISRNDLDYLNRGSDITYMLELTPSAVATSESGNGLGYTNFRIRGTDHTRINVTVNGIPLNDAESHSVFWVNMPDFASSVESIQIQRGVGTSTNGAAAFGATMNFSTISSSIKPYARIQASAGSFNTFKESVSVGTGVLNNGLSFDMRLSKLNSDGYVDYSGSDHTSMYFSGAWRNADNLLKANIIYGKEITGISWWGVPADSLDTNPTFNPAGQYIDAEGNRKYFEGQIDNYQQTHYQLLYSRKQGTHLYLNTALHYTKGGGYYQQIKDIDYELMYGWGDLSEMALNYYKIPDIIVGNDTITHSDVIRRKMMDNHFFGGTFSANYELGRLSSSLGGAWNRYIGDHFGNLVWMRYAGEAELDHEYYRNRGDKTDMNAFFKLNYQLTPELNIYGDMQYRHIEYIMEGNDDDRLPNGSQKVLDQQHTFDFINPKAGVFYQINNNMHTYFSFAIANREPTRTNFKDATGDDTKTPLPERLFDYELGYKYYSDKIHALVNLYYMDYLNQLIPTGEKSSVGYDIMTNVAESYRAGIEMAISVNPIKPLWFDANLTLSRNKITDFSLWATQYNEVWDEEFVELNLGETDIAYSPNIITSGTLRYNLFKSFNVSYIAKFVGEQYFDNTMSEQRKLDSYFVNNIQLDYNIALKTKQELSLRLNINNVFNVKYSSNAYGGVWYEQGDEKTWAYYYPQAGINFMLGLDFRF
jgi:iron complex outermembrane recepter protein